MRSWPAALVIVASFLTASASAQSPAPAATPSPVPPADVAADPDPDSADLSITGSVTYRELRFEEAGTPRVEFTGRVVAPELGPGAKLHTVWHADRGKLPRPVQTGVLYRDDTVKLTITTRFEDLARLFSEDAAAERKPVPAPTPSPASGR